MQLSVNLVDVLDFNLVRFNHFLLHQKLLKLLIILCLKVLLQAVSLGLEPRNNLAEAFVDVFQLLLTQTLDLPSLHVYEHFVVFVDALCVEQDFLQVANVSLDHGCDLVELYELVAIVFLEHATGADELVAVAAKVLDLLVLVLVAENPRHVSHLRLSSLDWRVHDLALDRSQLELVAEVWVLSHVFRLRDLHDF